MTGIAVLLIFFKPTEMYRLYLKPTEMYRFHLKPIFFFKNGSHRQVNVRSANTTNSCLGHSAYQPLLQVCGARKKSAGIV